MPRDAPGQQTPPFPERKLESWKDIAAYLHRTVRTTQRWEQGERLPIHRHPHGRRGSVYAYPSELDAWYQERHARLALEDTRLDEVTPPAAPRWRAFAAASAAALEEMIGKVLQWLRRPALSFVPRDWLLVTDFNNQTGEAVFDNSLTTAFRVSLEQSRHANVLRGSRLHAVLRRMGKSEDTKIDEHLGREICLREGVKALLTCGISRPGRQYALMARLIDPRSGETMRSHIVAAADQGSVLASLDRLASAVRKDLGGSLLALKWSGEALPKVTTPSLPALRAYAEGGCLWRKGQYEDSIKLYRSALELDSGFAMAHAALAGALLSHARWAPAEGRVHLEQALERPERLTGRERLHIQTNYHWHLGHVPEALQSFRLYLASYPDDASVRYEFGSFLTEYHRTREAIDELQQAVRLDPKFAAAYASLADCVAREDRAREALGLYAKALELEPSWIRMDNFNHEYGFTLADSGDPVRAREVFELALEYPETRAGGLRSLALLDMYQGKYRAARSKLSEAILLSKAGHDAVRSSRNHLLMSILLSALADHNGALQELDRADACTAGIAPVWLGARIGAGFARVGEPGKAAGILQRLQGQADCGSAAKMADLHMLEGEIELARGNKTHALELLQLAADEMPNPVTLAALAHGFQAAGQREAAQATCDRLLRRRRECLGWEPQQAWFEANIYVAEIRLDAGDAAGTLRLLDVLDRLWSGADRDLPLFRALLELRTLSAVVKPPAGSGPLSLRHDGS